MDSCASWYVFILKQCEEDTDEASKPVRTALVLSSLLASSVSTSNCINMNYTV